MSHAHSARPRIKLYRSEWLPFRHMADALERLATQVEFETCPLTELTTSLVHPELGPFLAAVDDEFMPPLIGIRPIIEGLNRRLPSALFLPADALDRAFARAIAEKVDEGFTRLSWALIDTHPVYGRPRWLPGSTAKDVILGDVDRRLPVLDNLLASRPALFVAGDRPSMADCLLDGYQRTAGELGLLEKFRAFEHLRRWSDAYLDDRADA